MCVDTAMIGPSDYEPEVTDELVVGTSCYAGPHASSPSQHLVWDSLKTSLSCPISVLRGLAVNTGNFKHLLITIGLENVSQLTQS